MRDCHFSFLVFPLFSEAGDLIFFKSVRCTIITHTRTLTTSLYNMYTYYRLCTNHI